MNAKSVLSQIKPLGSASYKKVLLNHGALEPCYGVKIEDLKKLQKAIGVDHRLALELFDTGVYDAQYLAGLIADDAQMTRKDLQKWIATRSAPLACSTVAWVAAGSPEGWDIALEWINSKEDLVATAGWSTLGCIVSVKPDKDLDLLEIRRLLKRVQSEIHKAPNEARSKMNGFVISVGCYVQALKETAIQTGEKIGPVAIDMGNTSCHVPFSPDSIRKVESRGAIGKKRKMAKC